MSSEKDGGPVFVWIEGNHNKPEPQKWLVLDYGTNQWRLKTGNILAAHPITDLEFQTEPIDALAKKYPAPIMYTIGG